MDVDVEEARRDVAAARIEDAARRDALAGSVETARRPDGLDASFIVKKHLAGFDDKIIIFLWQNASAVRDYHYIGLPHYSTFCVLDRFYERVNW